MDLTLKTIREENEKLNQKLENLNYNLKGKNFN